jgi:hypothetical protein
MTNRGNEPAARDADAEKVQFEMNFVATLKPAIKDIAKNNRRVAANVD